MDATKNKYIIEKNHLFFFENLMFVIILNPIPITNASIRAIIEGSETPKYKIRNAPIVIDAIIVGKKLPYIAVNKNRHVPKINNYIRCNVHTI